MRKGLKTETLKEFKECMSHYQKTGKVTYPLLKGFDQKGAWIGIPELLGQEVLDTTLIYKILQKPEILYKDTLFTSLVCESIDKLEIPYRIVKGSIHSPHTTEIYAPILTEVLGSIEMEDSLDFTAPRLKKVGGDLRLPQAEHVWLPTLEEVKGDLILGPSSLTLHCPKLRAVGGKISPSFNPTAFDNHRLWKKLSDKTLENQLVTSQRRIDYREGKEYKIWLKGIIEKELNTRKIIKGVSKNLSSGLILE